MIIVCGEALFDVFSDCPTVGGFGLSAKIGGSPFNLAVGLARLGERPMFFGGLSCDMFGSRLISALELEGVDISAVPRPAAPTPLVTVEIDGNGSPSYTLYGSATAERAVTVTDLARLPQAPSAVHVGSYCMVLEPVASTLRALVARQYGRSLIAYDPNVRLTIEPDIKAWTDAVAWMLPMTDLLKISEEDIAHLYPGMSPESFIELALQSDVALAVVTRGGKGVLASTSTVALLEVPAMAVEVIDTVGAGDTFQAALLSYLSHRGMLTRQALEQLDASALQAALTYASRASAITCSRRGADLPYFAEVNVDD
jgi:fructokinase